MRDLFREELNACRDGSERILVWPSIEGMWQGGLPYEEGMKIREVSQDLDWWFVTEFADPKVAQAVKRILDSVPGFFFKLAGLADTPQIIDWNLINQLRNHLRTAAWPTAYEVAINSTKTEASRRAAALIRRLMTAEEWRTEF